MEVRDTAGAGDGSGLGEGFGVGAAFAVRAASTGDKALAGGSAGGFDGPEHARDSAASAMTGIGVTKWRCPIGVKAAPVRVYAVDEWVGFVALGPDDRGPAG